MMKKIVISFSLLISALVADNTLVKITADTPYVNIKDNGVNVKITRIQDTANRLTDDYSRTSRLCPPHCIPKIDTVKGVETIGELELIDFIKNKVYKKKGILVDTRDKRRYMLETIPGAINIPVAISQVESKKVQDSLFKALGATPKGDGKYDFSNAKDMAVFCSGLWCPTSSKFIENMVKHGYPANKIKWYRDGLQAWKLLGLTTVIHQAQEVK